MIGIRGEQVIGQDENPHGFGTPWMAEHRLHQQINISQPAGKLLLKHRHRIEQRFVGSAAPDTDMPLRWTRQNRFRYMLRTDIPLLRAADERTLLYLGFSNEFMLRFASGSVPTFDQNRAYAGVGYRLSSALTLECGVFNQRLQQRGGTLSNNVLHVSFISTAPLRRLLSR